VADGLARAMRDARARTVGFSAAVGPDRRELLAADTVLRALERRLRASEPVSVRGAAPLYVLLSDGSSSLYRSGGAGELGSQLRAAAAALEPSDAREQPRAANQIWQEA
jgi:hypothetical protein